MKQLKLLFWAPNLISTPGQHPEMGAISFQDVVPMPYDNIYYYDYHGWRDTRTDITEAVNAFTAENGELLTAVSFYTAVDNVDYTIKIYDDTTSTDFINELTTQSGTIEYTGFHTIQLTNPVHLTLDDDFYVYVSLSDGGHAFDRTSDVPVLLGASYKTVVVSAAKPGESYFKQDGHWVDFYLEESTGNFCIKALTEIGVSFEADTTYGWVPLDVKFDATSKLSVDTWTWNFGDGDMGYLQNPTHVYEERGMYDVTLEVNAGGDIRSLTHKNYILALADTIKTDTCYGEAGSDICITIRSYNTVPITNINIPLEYPGNLGLTLDSFNTTGCRTEYFETCELLHYDPFNRRFIFNLQTDDLGEYPDLEPGEGDVLKIYMSVSPSAVMGQYADIILDGYNNLEPCYFGHYIDYNIASIGAAVLLQGCCHDIRGNIDNDPEDLIDISDLVYLVNYQFGGGPEPE